MHTKCVLALELGWKIDCASHTGGAVATQSTKLPELVDFTGALIQKLGISRY